MDNKLIITEDDNFVFIDVTGEAERLFEIYDLYVWDGESEWLVDTIYDIRRAIGHGSRIVIEGGHLPKQRTLKFRDVDKVLIDGHWFGKYSQILT
jgi:hypothetical protein